MYRRSRWRARSHVGVHPETTSRRRSSASRTPRRPTRRGPLDFATLDVEGAAREAVEKTKASHDARDWEPGTYEVVLEPYCVYDIVGFLGAQLTGLAVEEGRSFVGGKLGQRVTGPVTLVDDPFDPQGMARAFDFEGQPSERVTLIENGIARAVVYDSSTAHRAGVRNTGHALPANPFAPSAPMHRRLEPGDKTRDELIKGVRRGLLVTRFHYTRWVHQLRTIVTGMTRDGTFAIIDGEIAHPVKNLRFTQSYHEAARVACVASAAISPCSAGASSSAARRRLASAALH